MQLGYRYGQCGANFRTGTEFAVGGKFGTVCTDGDDERSDAASNGFLLHGFWRPVEFGWMPTISAGVGMSYLTRNEDWDDNTNKRAKASWMVGLT